MEFFSQEIPRCSKVLIQYLWRYQGAILLCCIFFSRKKVNYGVNLQICFCILDEFKFNTTLTNALCIFPFHCFCFCFCFVFFERTDSSDLRLFRKKFKIGGLNCSETSFWSFLGWRSVKKNT